MIGRATVAPVEARPSEVRARLDRASVWHAATAVVAAVALAIQIGLVISGASVLVTTSPVPDTATRLLRFFSYFTVQSNILVAITALSLVRRPSRDGRVWRVVRLDALVGITVTGVVHWFLLRPLLNLHGWSYATDKLLHVVVPLMAVVGWVMFGPRSRLTPSVLLPALIWPVAYLGYTLAMGADSGWYPYPFLDVGRHGYPRVLANGAVIAVLFVATAALSLAADRRLARSQGGAARPAAPGS